MKIKLTPPKFITFIIALILGILGLLGFIITIPFISGIAFWLVFVGWLLLILAMLIKGL